MLCFIATRGESETARLGSLQPGCPRWGSSGQLRAARGGGFGLSPAVCSQPGLALPSACFQHLSQPQWEFLWESQFCKPGHSACVYSTFPQWECGYVGWQSWASRKSSWGAPAHGGFIRSAPVTLCNLRDNCSHPKTVILLARKP